MSYVTRNGSKARSEYIIGMIARKIEGMAGMNSRESLIERHRKINLAELENTFSRVEKTNRLLFFSSLSLSLSILCIQ
jgi:hypothetical protein